jgi:hypothetical protein
VVNLFPYDSKRTGYRLRNPGPACGRQGLKPGERQAQVFKAGIRFRALQRDRNLKSNLRVISD